MLRSGYMAVKVRVNDCEGQGTCLSRSYTTVKVRVHDCCDQETRRQSTAKGEHSDKIYIYDAPGVVCLHDDDDKGYSKETA